MLAKRIVIVIKVLYFTFTSTLFQEQLILAITTVVRQYTLQKIYVNNEIFAPTGLVKYKLLDFIRLFNMNLHDMFPL